MGKIRTNIGVVAKANAILDRFIEETSLLKVPTAYKVAQLSRDLSLLLDTTAALLEKFEGNDDMVGQIMSSEVEIEDYGLTVEEICTDNDSEATVKEVRTLLDMLRPT